MSLAVPLSVLERTSHPTLVKKYEHSKNWRNQEGTTIDFEDLTKDVLDDLSTAADGADASFGRIVKAVDLALTGDFSKSIPKFAAAPPIVEAFLRHDLIDGWLYEQASDGHLYPQLVTGIAIERGRHPQDPDHLVIHLLSNNTVEALGSNRARIQFAPEDVTRKKVGAMLASKGFLKETPELKAAYEKELESYRKELTSGFAQQYRYTGKPLSWRSPARENRKVIHDIAPDQIPAFNAWAPSSIVPDVPASDGRKAEKGVGPVPIRPVLRVFDLRVHEFLWVNAGDLTTYVYDASLGKKLILPPDQRELLDILTTDIGTFTSDIIEGKSAGNLILCKGVPGVGKTLSAEIYSELIERPLYSIHSGTLGTSAGKIRENLETVFRQAKRWDAVLLLDEADVFVMERGSNIEQNAIVAEFLRTIEYFSGLMFMTTNRANNIDEAIISRSAAIIDYKVPERDGARQIWQVMATNYGTELAEPLLEALLDGFPEIAPRDIKMLLRLALRVASQQKEALSIDTFRRCAMFRGLHLVTDNA